MPQPREQVWQAIATSTSLADWMYPNDFEPRVGHTFTFQVPGNPKVGFDGLTVYCEVLECDPPRHTALRRPLAAALLPAVVNRLEPRIRALAASLVEGFVARGHCEFVSEFAQILPICIFLDLVDLPREDRDFLLPITEKVVRGRTAEMRLEGETDLHDYIGRVVRERRATFEATPEQNALRPGPVTAYKNLFLAGDWTATGLPATIEGSVRSGDRAADLVLAARGA